MAAVVAVDGIAHDAARHELRHADGAGVGAARFQVELALHYQRQEIPELASEHGGAFGFVRVGIVEGQRGQRVQYAEIAHIASIQRFDADDGGDDGAGTPVRCAAWFSRSRFSL